MNQHRMFSSIIFAHPLRKVAWSHTLMHLGSFSFLLFILSFLSFSLFLYLSHSVCRYSQRSINNSRKIIWSRRRRRSLELFQNSVSVFAGSRKHTFASEKPQARFMDTCECLRMCVSMHVKKRTLSFPLTKAPSSNKGIFFYCSFCFFFFLF